MANQTQTGTTTPAQPAVAPVTNPAPVAPVAPQAPVQPVPVTPAAQPIADTSAQRTREEFEKLLESNRKLHTANSLLQEEIARRTNVQQQFAPVQQPVAPQTPNIQDFVEIDPDTGTKYINERKLQSAIAEANTRASQAVTQMQNYIQANEQREIDRQNKEAFSAYPELNPSNQNFNRDFSNSTSALILHSYMNPRNYSEGRPLTFKEAADLVRKGQGISQQVVAPATQPQAPIVQANTSTQDLRGQASVSLQSVPQQVMASPEVAAQVQALRERTRLGDDAALAERLKYTEHIIPKEGTS